MRRVHEFPSRLWISCVRTGPQSSVESTTMSDPYLLLGHRGAGASSSVPENTLAAFDLALEHGCDGFEFDVRLTADKQAVVCHDPKHGRSTIARAQSLRLADLPRLDEVLRHYGQRVFLDIELKVSGLESIV